MLYNTDWSKLSDNLLQAFAMGNLISWLEKKPVNETYDYSSNKECLLAQYFTDMGFEDVVVFSDRVYLNGKGYDLPEIFNQIAMRFPRTFGNALNRAKHPTILQI